MLGPDDADNSSRKNLRMNKEDVFELARLLEPIIRPKENSPNYRQVTTEKKLTITLYYLEDTGSLWMTANTFGIHPYTVSKTSKVCKPINEFLGPKNLYLPRNTRNEKNSIKV